MGIVNANPDSFSDAVRTTTLDAQVALALRLVADGADLIDVGGESGVTYTGVTAAEVERDRVVPLVERLVAEGVTVSVDTLEAAVARRRAGRRRARPQRRLGPARPGAGRRGGAHRRGAGRDAHARGAQAGALRRLRRRRRQRCGGLRGERCALRAGARRRARAAHRRPRPGLRQVPGRDGRGAARHRRAARARPSGLPAVSRKYFLGAITGRPPAERLAGHARRRRLRADHGAAIVRVHDVAATVDYLARPAVLPASAEVGEFDADDDGLKWIRARREPSHTT